MPLGKSNSKTELVNLFKPFLEKKGLNRLANSDLELDFPKGKWL